MNEASQPSATTQQFSVPLEIFNLPNLDIYAQMACIVLRLYSNESMIPSLSEVAEKGRMSAKQAAKALQSLVELRILSHKVFREIVGDFGDDRLSWAAKGLLAFLKNNANASLDELVDLAGQSKDDRRAVLVALNELKRFGYLEDTALHKEAHAG